MVRPSRRSLLRGLALCLGVFELACAVVAGIGLKDQLVDTDLVIVPGNTVNPNGHPSDRLAARLDAALALYQAGHCRVILVSGGIDVLGFDEAQVMAAYLQAKGVPRSAIHTDNRGINTYETARYAARLIREQHYRPPLLASQYFHIARIELALSKQGIATGGHVHARYFELRDIFSLAREVPGLLSYAFKPGTS